MYESKAKRILLESSLRPPKLSLPQFLSPYRGKIPNIPLGTHASSVLFFAPLLLVVWKGSHFQTMLFMLATIMLPMIGSHPHNNDVLLYRISKCHYFYRVVTVRHYSYPKIQPINQSDNFCSSSNLAERISDD